MVAWLVERFVEGSEFEPILIFDELEQMVDLPAESAFVGLHLMLFVGLAFEVLHFASEFLEYLCNLGMAGSLLVVEGSYALGYQGNMNFAIHS